MGRKNRTGISPNGRPTCEVELEAHLDVLGAPALEPLVEAAGPVEVAGRHPQAGPGRGAAGARRS
jgi:hypothetical protein